jgi:hypothetical protein
MAIGRRRRLEVKSGSGALEEALEIPQQLSRGAVASHPRWIGRCGRDEPEVRPIPGKTMTAAQGHDETLSNRFTPRYPRATHQ